MNSGAGRHALLIGVELYTDSRLERLPSARADVAELAHVLQDRTIGGFAVEVYANPTAEGMRAAIRKFCAERNPTDLAVIYVSGHGMRCADGEFIFVASDTDVDNLAETGVRAGILNGAVEECYATQKVAILDTCESGGFSLGFRTTRAKSADPRAAPVAGSTPLTPSGVYVLASSDVGEKSYSGPGSTVEDPRPSVFTGAIIDILSSGAAGSDASGYVSVDELFEAARQRLLGADPPQRAVKSANRVSGDIVIAARPLGEAPTPIVERRTLVELPAEVGGVPSWPELISYYLDVVVAECDDAGLLKVRSNEHVVVSGRERILCGDVDPDDCVPVPPGAEGLVDQILTEGGATLWAGWPAVVLVPRGRRSRSPEFAPLLMRRLEIVRCAEGIRLRPEGSVIPHPGLAKDRLGPDDAALLAESYVPTWHRGEQAAMARDAGQLLRDTYALGTAQELRPHTLDPQIDLATPAAGARNAEVLFTLKTAGATMKLRKDLQYIRDNPTRIAHTALAGLYPGAAAPATCSSSDTMTLVTPLAANPAQRAVLARAMRDRLTVATGPPGTGKSQLVVDVVATAVAAGQTVLVASTNNRAVDEIYERCERIRPGFVLRTGNKEAMKQEAAGLDALLTGPPARRSGTTRQLALREATRAREDADGALRRAAELEAGLFALARKRECVEQEIGATVSELAERLGEGWGVRARKLSRAWFLGESRRRRFLDAAGITADTTSLMCSLIGRLAEVVAHWDGELRKEASLGSGSELLTALERAEASLTQRSQELISDKIADLTKSGTRAIETLCQARQNGERDWAALKAALSALPAWAVTSPSARRFPDQAGLFDLVVIDEASQCSIPSIVPLLFRARRALIIGDAMQLPHIATLDRNTDDLLRARWKISREWLDEHRLSPLRHSAFAAAEKAVGQPLLLAEHYRCHPAIAEFVNRHFYHGRLTVLTDVAAPERVSVAGPPITWRQVAGHATRGADGRSWRNSAEVEEVAACVREILGRLPPDGSVGVVSFYRAQCDEINALLGHDDRVKVGTAHAFQGGECDVIVLSLVASKGHPPRAFDWADQQPQIWNVAITRARSALIVVGDEEVWAVRGGIGGELLSLASSRPPAPAQAADDDELAHQLYVALTGAMGEDNVDLDVWVDGRRADAVVSGPSLAPRPILLDRGAGSGADPGAHLRRMLQETRLRGVSACRLPAWRLYTDSSWLRETLGR